MERDTALLICGIVPFAILSEHDIESCYRQPERSSLGNNSENN
jgi:hypothetical protein